MKPSKQSDLVIEEIDGEYLVFAGDTNVAALNAPAVAVFELCDGRRDVDAIVAALADGPTPLEPEAVRLAFAELAEFGLVDRAEPVAPDTRRQLLKKFAVGASAALAVPVVEGIVAPTVAAAVSDVPTPAPTSGPTPPPTTGPTMAPTLAPTEPPTAPPIPAPTFAPTDAPTPIE